MKAKLTKWRVLGILGIVGFSLLALFATPKEKPLPKKVEAKEKKLEVLGNLKPRKLEENEDEKKLIFKFRGKADRVEVIATEPGMYPAKSIESDLEGGVPLSFFDGFKGEFEFMVRQTGDSEVRGAYWGPWKFSVSDAFRLKSASDLVVKFTDSEGLPVPQAKLRLGRDSVSLLWLEAVTDEDGLATFSTLPQGRYVVSGSHQGKTSEIPFIHHSSQKEVLLKNQPTFTLKGIVKNENGKPVPDAMIECYLDGQDFASDIVSTDLFGQFNAELKGRAGDIVVRHARFVTSYTNFSDTDLDGLDIVLQKGEDKEVRVRDKFQRPVGGALVSWSLPERPDRIGEAKPVDESGEASFKGVPTGAVFTAYLGGFSSPPTEAEGTKVELELVAENDLKRRIHFRANLVSGVEIFDVSARQSNSLCKVNLSSDRDFEIVGCREGEFELKFKTNHGEKNMSVDLKDGSEISLGEPRHVHVLFNGTSNEKWTQTKINIGSKKIQLDLLNEDLAEWKGRLFPGIYSVTIENARIGSTTYSFDSNNKREFQFALKAPTTKKFWFVDSQQAPITNAYIMLWKGDTLVDVASSGGQLPTEFRQVDFEGYSIIALDPQRGEGGGTIEDVEERIVLSKTIGSLKIPMERVDKDEIKHELGISFAAKDRGFLIDVQTGSLGESIGIQDGDFWVSAYFDASKRIQIIVSRNGRFQVTSFDSVLDAK